MNRRGNLVKYFTVIIINSFTLILGYSEPLCETPTCITLMRSSTQWKMSTALTVFLELLPWQSEQKSQMLLVTSCSSVLL